MTKKLYVGNLNYSVTNEELREHCEPYGEVIDVKIIEGRGFGFVEFAEPEQAMAAKEGLNETDFKGRTMKVNEARPQNDNRNNNRNNNRNYNRR